jgi:hypothetical protein
MAHSQRGRPTGRDPACAELTHDVARSVWGTLQSVCYGMTHGGSPVANQQPCCSRLQARTIGCRLARRGLKRKAWTDHIDVNTTCMARSVARVVVDDSWTVGRKVNMGAVHGPQCTCLTWLRASTCSEEGERRRCGAHWRGRRC